MLKFLPDGKLADSACGNCNTIRETGYNPFKEFDARAGMLRS